MLIICNGPIKSGSTWLYNILLELIPLERPPEKYLTKGSLKGPNPTIRPDALENFLKREDLETHNYITKNHLGKLEHRNLIARHSDMIRLIDIERDLRDVIVSSYHDARNRHGFEGSFADFYWQDGRYLAASILLHHQIWENHGPGFYKTTYAGLKSDFAAEVNRICDFLGISKSAQEIEAIRQSTSMEKLRQRYQGTTPLYEGDRFFRKGQIGDWRNHFDERLLRDLRAIERRGIPAHDPYQVMRALRRKLFGSVR